MSQPYFAHRTCQACDRGEKTTTPPHSSIVGSMPVHYPSGNVCMKYLPQEQYDMLLRAHAVRMAAKREQPMPKPTIAEIPEVWAIKYEDAEIEDDVFAGEGAEYTAKRAYKLRSMNWSCYLLCPAERLSRLEADDAALRARCERYEKPVSDEEIVAFLTSFEEADGQDVTEWRRQALTAFLVARKGE